VFEPAAIPPVAGIEVFGPIDQAQFLNRLGIETRATALKKKAASRAAAGGSRSRTSSVSPA